MVGHSVKKSVDSVEFHKINSMREGNNGNIDNFDMDILDEGALDWALTFPEKTSD